jgi:hypothetical protein
MDGTGSGSGPVAGFGSNDVQPTDPTVRLLTGNE